MPSARRKIVDIVNGAQKTCELFKNSGGFAPSGKISAGAHDSHFDEPRPRNLCKNQTFVLCTHLTLGGDISKLTANQRSVCKIDTGLAAAKQAPEQGGVVRL